MGYGKVGFGKDKMCSYKHTHNSAVHIGRLVKIKCLATSSTDLELKSIENFMDIVAAEFKRSFSQKLPSGVEISASLNYNILECGSQCSFFTELVNNDIKVDDPSNTYSGYTFGGIGNTQVNDVQVKVTENGVSLIDPLSESFMGVVRTFLHELGHTAGLVHPWELAADNPLREQLVKRLINDNLMFTTNSKELGVLNKIIEEAGLDFRFKPGFEVEASQMETVIETVSTDTEVSPTTTEPKKATTPTTTPTEDK